MYHNFCLDLMLLALVSSSNFLFYVLKSVKTAPSLTDAALTRIAQGTKVLAEGGYENIYRQTFETAADEYLQNYFACYLSTSAGPIMGVLYVSSAKLAFCSDNPLSYKANNKTEWSYYKVWQNLDLYLSFEFYMKTTHSGRSCRLFKQLSTKICFLSSQFFMNMTIYHGKALVS